MTKTGTRMMSFSFNKLHDTKPLLILSWKDEDNKNFDKLLETFTLWIQKVLQDKRPQDLAKAYGIDIKIDPLVGVKKESIEK